MALATVSMLLLSLGLSSAAGLSRAVRDPGPLNASMLRAMERDPVDTAVKSSFAAMQLELRCCGVQSYSDWYRYRQALPPACCGRVWNGKHLDQCNVPLFKTGCLQRALLELRSFTNAICALASAIVMVLVMIYGIPTYYRRRLGIYLTDINMESGCVEVFCVNCGSASGCMVLEDEQILQCIQHWVAPRLGVTLFTAAYVVVSGVVERGEGRNKLQPQPLRIACLTQPQLLSLAPQMQTAQYMPQPTSPTVM
ncbi:unnamed protein product [Diatraea saccharalis]|uniref:Tetraspanin n=1 Tax=Diatraea saccharalis TaxID=40085 RepID=A0A9N9R9F5_9NEOP|nr:unnamed protein product [Diatraea saccharalis]